MGRQTINNGESGAIVRSKLNSNFEEIYVSIDTVTVDVDKNTYVWSKESQIADDTVQSAWIFGGSPANGNVIGSSTFTPNSPGTTTTSWGADSGYPGGISVVSLLSGYDSLVNQVGAVMVGANHSMIHYNVNGHAVIIGGSTCLIAGARSSIIGSRSSEIGAASSFSTIVSADNCEIQGSDYCLVAGLNVNVNTGSHNSFVVARNAEIDHSGSIVFGNGVNSVYPGGMVRGGQTFVENNDGVLADFVQTRRTTDATAQNPTGGGWELDDTKVTSGTMKVTVHAQQDGSADGDNSGNYEVSSWAADIGFRWDGTNGYLYDDTTTAGPSTNPVLNIKQIRDGIGVAAAPQLKINTGSLRVTVTGAASKTINFLVHIQAVSTLTS